DGTALDGTRLQLPAELPARRTLVLLAFRQRQQAQVDRWTARAVAELGIPATTLGLAADAPTAVIEVPCLGRRWRPARRVIDGGMASSIADPAILARTVTVYADVGAILRALGATGPALVQARVVERSGAVCAAGSGEPEGAGWQAIADALSAPTAPPR
ncbi:MAG: hypothetical protein ACR2JV_07310, partial [Gaiellales bacterium]